MQDDIVQSSAVSLIAYWGFFLEAQYCDLSDDELALIAKGDEEEEVDAKADATKQTEGVCSCVMSNDLALMPYYLFRRQSAAFN